MKEVIKRAISLWYVALNILLYKCYQRKPINNNLIVFESEGDLSDNSYALYSYMQRNGYLKKYHVVWLVEDVDKACKNEHCNTEFIYKWPTRFNPKWSKTMSTAKWYIYDHCNVIANYKGRKDQNIIYISHGFGVKAGKTVYKHKNDFDVNIVLGEIPAENAPLDWGGTIEQTRQWGYPRNDYLFKKSDAAKQMLQDKYDFDKYKNAFLWMPTFRQSANKLISEDYIDDETGLPLFPTYGSLKQFDSFLHEKNILLMFKVHHLQADLDVFKKKYNNIIIVRDEELIENNVQLYEIINFTDALITDYSSISSDYMLLDRPIIYTLDDYEEYKRARGLSPENALDLLVGYHVYSVSELETAMGEIVLGVDKYREKRNELLPFIHRHIDGNASKRIVKNLKL